MVIEPLSDEEIDDLRHVVEHENDPLSVIEVHDPADPAATAELLKTYDVVRIFKNGQLHSGMSKGGNAHPHWEEDGPALLAAYDMLKEQTKLEKVFDKKCKECNGQGNKRIFRGDSQSGAWDQECSVCHGTGRKKFSSIEEQLEKIKYSCEQVCQDFANELIEKSNTECYFNKQAKELSEQAKIAEECVRRIRDIKV